MTHGNHPPATPLPRRTFLAQAGAGLAAGVAAAAGASLPATAAPTAALAAPGATPFWPDGARIVISISMQFEAGGQPPTGADSPFPTVAFPPSVPVDLASATWFAYGYREGIPRLLDLWDRHGVKVTSHMIGEAARRHPDLAREIVSRGHEAAAHGPTWRAQFTMSRDDERRFLTEARDMVEAVTGQRPTGYNCNWLRRGPHTLSLLQELGYTYHIDDVSRDEPFVETVGDRDFAVVPYTLRNNDILLIEGRHYTPAMFLEQIKLDFDQLYAEAGQRRRLMSISAHDRISGTPQMVRAWDDFLHYARSHPGVAFMRKDDIARFALRSPSTLRETETI
ncbi:polysaccharide deacetylase family protein [Burkholderia cenocepacia]|uniref:polysaccharide deacetylase family protein n=1 Tax=Burkholderia cenocepacia TaxID=95486 RepID=UPI00078C9972|nr:polysaccharide deacetylase family protein [Burkholderia cenocepacia]AMU14967.1 polysaccharide deacetylase [Burkholderia cenocepacia]MCW3588888.1 polysaccharide deacetylase family protein [Burkholderia cenocepacia]MCW3633920.1 polysaccharide deacetylase family protein [Burkholderia cenocepacia]MCW3648804.1 polysaccharide deacetylase family protein [Burkholderia cenocepacia]MCW5184833.1 polysaccharide deacetylase family protein [Burkholderia cenocepacia]